MIERGVALMRALQDSPIRQVVVQPTPQQQQQRGSGHRAVPAVADALRTAVAELAAISGVSGLSAPPPQKAQPLQQGQAAPAPAVATAGGATSQPLPPPQKQGKGAGKKGSGAK